MTPGRERLMATGTRRSVNFNSRRSLVNVGSGFNPLLLFDGFMLDTLPFEGDSNLDLPLFAGNRYRFEVEDRSWRWMLLRRGKRVSPTDEVAIPLDQTVN